MNTETENTAADTPVKKPWQLWQLLCTDLLLAVLILISFAYFQHGRAYLRGETVAELSAAEILPTAQPTAAPESTDSSPFTDGEIIQTENSYISANVNVSWTRHEDDSTGHHVVYYVTDILLSSPEYLCTALAVDGYKYMSVLAEENNAIVAINGDYSLARLKGPIVREGILMRESSFGDVLVMYTDGSMETFSEDDFDIDAIADKGVDNVWSFGPSLLDRDGKAKTQYNTTVVGANPRTAIGYYEPGHYCFVVVDGRGKNGSYGAKMQTLSAIFEQLGCKVAYNLDGGQSSLLAWNLGSTIINSPVYGGRELGDIIYVPKV